MYLFGMLVFAFNLKTTMRPEYSLCYSQQFAYNTGYCPGAVDFIPTLTLH
jgi:hypothetical protein